MDQADAEILRQITKHIAEVRAESLVIQAAVSRLIVEIAALHSDPKTNIAEICEALAYMRNAIDKQGANGHEAAHEAVERIIEGTTISS
jgi:hypothetical protein